MTSFLVRRLNSLATAAGLALLAACQTPGGSGAPDFGDARPHYKVGAPYQVKGRWYHPKEEPGYEAVGIASWYGDAFHGKRTANGEIFDKTRLSAAHPTLPMPTLVEVRNLENGRTITVRVNDRGPFVSDRVIDLSHAAATALGFDKQGLARVHVRYLGRADLFALAAPGKDAGKLVRVASAPPPRPRPKGDAPSPAPGAAPPPDRVTSFIEAALAAPAAAEFWISIADYTDLNALEADRVALAPGEGSRVVSAAAGGRYELQVGPHADFFAAEARLAALREAGYPSARVVAGSR